MAEAENPGSTDQETSSTRGPAKIETTYGLNEEGRVINLEFTNDVGFVCKASLRSDDPAYYDYSSKLLDDENFVQSAKSMTLADVILAANVDLGLIPPMDFDQIQCRNKH